MLYFYIYLLCMNLFGMTLMGVDKSRAKRHAWRVPEKTFFIVSAIGGSVGTWMGMYLYRHKTKHWYFVVGMPAILVLQVIVLALLQWKGFITFI